MPRLSIYHNFRAYLVKRILSRLFLIPKDKRIFQRFDLVSARRTHNSALSRLLLFQSHADDDEARVRLHRQLTGRHAGLQHHRRRNELQPRSDDPCGDQVRPRPAELPVHQDAQLALERESRQVRARASGVH